MKAMRHLPVLLAALLLGACVSNDDNQVGNSGAGGDGGNKDTGPLIGCAALNTIDLGADGTAIADLDAANLSPIVTDVFARYAAVTTPSAKRIHFLAQSGVSDAKIRRAREILRMHLEDLTGTSAGASKADVADAVSGRCGTVAIFRDAGHYDLQDAAVRAFDADFGNAYVPLFGDAIVVEGSLEYLAASPAIDETFGATSALVYRHGLDEFRPAWSTQLRLASAAAQADRTFAPDGPGPYRDLDELYLATVLSVHAGIWGHNPSGDGSARDGVYAFGSRPALEAGDLSTLQLIEDFFTPHHTFLAQVDPSFASTFDLLFRPSVGYTSRAQYLTNVRLTGANPSELFGAPVASRLVGNSANNNIRGRQGDDAIDGGPGLDSAIFGAPRNEFDIVNNGDGTFSVRHNAFPSLGTDTLRNVEIAVFTGGTNVQL